jgi:hypothetical protein
MTEMKIDMKVRVEETNEIEGTKAGTAGGAKTRDKKGILTQRRER